MLTKSSDRLLKIVERLASWHWLHNAQLEPIEPKAVLEANAQRSNFPPVPITPGLRRTAYTKSWMSWIWTAVRTVNLESPSLCNSMVLNWKPASQFALFPRFQQKHLWLCAKIFACSQVPRHWAYRCFSGAHLSWSNFIAVLYLSHKGWLQYQQAELEETKPTKPSIPSE